MNRENFEKYAALKAEEKRIKAEIAEIAPLLKETIATAGGDKVDVTGVGLFTMKKVQVFSFSEAVEAKEKEVEVLKDKEKADGTAKVTIREDLVFTAPKPPKEEVE